MNEKELFLTFTEQLGEWSRTGKEPELGDWNIRAYLDMQEHRLQKKGIQRTVDYSIEGNVQRVGDYAISSLLNGYNKRLNCALGKEKISYNHNNKEIFRETREISIFQLIKQPQHENKDRRNETYVCPNCGNITQIAALEDEGCAYCGTHFLMSQLYPKVTNFYILDNLPVKKFGLRKLLKLLKWCFIFATVFTPLLLVSLSTGDSKILEHYKASEIIPMMYLGTFIFGLLFSPIILRAGESIPVMVGMAGAKAKITAELQKFDPTFSYDYFEGKALSLMRMILYADDPMEYVQYEGNGIAPSLGNIVDMEYRGGLGVEKIEKVDGYVVVKLKVYMKNMYFNGTKIKSKSEVVNLHMKHNAKWKVQPDFSIVKVSCHGCGGSFDATRNRCCPYCGNQYDAGIDDWTVLDISISAKK